MGGRDKRSGPLTLFLLSSSRALRTLDIQVPLLHVLSQQSVGMQTRHPFNQAPQRNGNSQSTSDFRDPLFAHLPVLELPFQVNHFLIGDSPSHLLVPR